MMESCKARPDHRQAALRRMTITNSIETVNPMSAIDSEVFPHIGDRTLYDQLMSVARNRITTRQFDPGYVVPDEHYELVLEAARHAPSGANAQPWHYIIVRDPSVKQKIADYFVEEQRFRAKLKMKFPTPNYEGLREAPGALTCHEPAVKT